MAIITNGSVRLNIWVKINEQLVWVLIDFDANRVYITPVYTKH